MHRGFGVTEFEPVEEKPDRELTLGPTSLAFLALLFCGICALCFLWGYSVGHRGAGEIQAAAQPDATEPSPAQPVSNQPKPQASENTPQPAVTQPAEAAGASVQDSPASATTTVAPASATVTPGSATSSSPSGGVVVQAALPTQPASVQPSTVRTVQPAINQNAPWTVQIAAVSQQEDADVLVSALRKRGYAVSAHHDPGDNLIHVQVGPFSNHADADSMRQRLLNDGYNAIIEP